MGTASHRPTPAGSVSALRRDETTPCELTRRGGGKRSLLFGDLVVACRGGAGADGMRVSSEDRFVRLWSGQVAGGGGSVGVSGDPSGGDVEAGVAGGRDLWEVFVPACSWNP
ncbi:hypothetical protein GUJ93_ZPchr0013g35724 [Zizania palustris]|uniref:Uncharacterized protein n=1 Tax=Zizania palustris TaxID=103762 RepID=A0A8J6C2S3_ZIZPA|nr:hypothetical protein GUJ93_ZPchr0013g35724 [Zizania palustris]